jgi:hypothetical protein
MAKKNINIMESLSHFFRLPDWQDRCLKLGGVYAGLTALNMIIGIATAIPFIGIFCSFFQFGISILVFIFGIYLQGYRYEVTKAYVSNSKIEDIKPLDRYVERFATGLQLLLCNLVYSMPAIILYLIAIGTFFIPFIFDSSLESSGGLPDGLVFALIVTAFIPVMLGILWQSLVEYFIVPAVTNEFLKEESLAAMFRLKNVWKFIRRNVLSLLIYLAISIVLGGILAILYLTSWLLVFLCIGIFLLPVLMAITIPYMAHFQAHVIAQMAEGKTAN